MIIETVMRSLVCDADCATTYGPVDMPTLRRVRLEARREGWALRFIDYRGQRKLADLCPEHRDIQVVM